MTTPGGRCNLKASVCVSFMELVFYKAPVSCLILRLQSGYETRINELKCFSY